MSGKNVSFQDDNNPKNDETEVLEVESAAGTEQLNSNKASPIATPVDPEMEEPESPEPEKPKRKLVPDDSEEPQGLDDESFGGDEIKIEYKFPELDKNGMEYADKIEQNILEKLKLSLGLSMTSEEDHERLIDFFQ